MFRKKKPMPNTPPHIAEQAEKIAQLSPIIQDLDDHIAKNHLEPGEKLIFRLLRHSYVNDIRLDLRITPLAEHMKTSLDNPSLLYQFRHETGKALVTWFFIFLGVNIIYSILEQALGLADLIKVLLP